MIEVFPYADEADEQRGLDVYNAVWPHDRVGIDEERSYRASLRDHVDLLARIDGDVGGLRARSDPAGVARVRLRARDRAARATAPGCRHRPVRAISAWARERGLDTIETIVADNDPESLAFAQRRGFAEESQRKGSRSI